MMAGPSEPDSGQRFEGARARLSYAAAVLHTIDLNGLARVHEKLVSPQALLDGFSPGNQQTAEDWLAIIKAAQALRDASSFAPDVLDAVEKGLPPFLGVELQDADGRAGGDA